MAHEQLNHHPHFKHSSSLRPNSSSFVRSLNNRACVLVAMGNFSKANDFFEMALTNHQKTVSNDEDDYDGDSVTMMDGYDEYFESSFDDKDEDFDFVPATDAYNGNVIHCDHHHQPKNTATTPSNITHALSRSSSLEENPRNDSLLSTTTKLLFIPPSPTGLCRMSSCSQLRILPYSGQETNRSSNKWMLHQVYSLPIVMSETEWENATIQDRSFVLIFNSALCNHITGMQLLHHHQRQLQSTQKLQQDHQPNTDITSPPPYQDMFEVARMLYTLALEVFSNSTSGQTLGQQKPLLGIDRLCYPAVFNNLSHVCKTLEGHNSHDAYKYDTLLLKSIYWLRNSNSASTSTAANAAESLSSMMTVQNIHNNIHSHNDSYNDDDAEIIDAFLENVFYLIGTPSSVAPARAA